MRALTFEGKEKISFSTIADPIIEQPNDVIVKVKLCAICGSDLHLYHEREKGIDHGTAMGHEFVGEVVEVGKGVKDLRKGEVVMSPFTTSCGQCYFCLAGLTCRCIYGNLFGWREKGKGLHGGQAEFIRVPLADSTLKKIPEGLTLEEGLMLGDIFSTGFFCALQAEIKPGSSCAVVGCGPVGLMAILGARHFGAEQIFAIDTVKERLEISQTFGATPVNGSSVDVKSLIIEKTNGLGVKSVMEAVGSSSTIKIAYDILQPGGTISMVGVCNDSSFGFTPTDAYNKNVTFKIGRCPARKMMDDYGYLLVQKKYPVNKIITHKLPLSEGSRGYDLFSNKRDNCLKVILNP